MKIRLTVLFAENGDPILPPEWWAVPSFDQLKKSHGAQYMKIVVFLNAYRSPYRNPDKKYDLKARVGALMKDWSVKWGKGTELNPAVLASEVFLFAQEDFIEGQFDSLWDQLLMLEEKESQLRRELKNLSFSSEEIVIAETPTPQEEEEAEAGGRTKAKKPKPPRAPLKPVKPTAQARAEVIKSQAGAYKELQGVLKTTIAEAEQLRQQLWREVKSNRPGRASDVLHAI